MMKVYLLLKHGCVLPLNSNYHHRVTVTTDNPTNDAAAGDRGGTPTPTCCGLFALQVPTASTHYGSGSRTIIHTIKLLPYI